MTVEEARGSARVRLGHSELTVRPVGLGCMGMSQFYGAADDSESVETIRSAIDLGVDFLDTSDAYGAADLATATNVRGFGHNEQLIGAAIDGRRDSVVLATKFGVTVTMPATGSCSMGVPSTSPRRARRAFADWAPTSSTCITVTGSIRMSRSKTPSGRWPNWSPPARSARWDSVR